jgi:hypothetical protein
MLLTFKEKARSVRRPLAASSKGSAYGSEQGELRPVLCAHGGDSRLDEPTSLPDQSGTLRPAGEKEIQNGEIGDKVPPQLGVNWGFILIVNYPDTMAVEEFLVKILV